MKIYTRQVSLDSIICRNPCSCLCVHEDVPPSINSPKSGLQIFPVQITHIFSRLSDDYVSFMRQQAPEAGSEPASDDADQPAAAVQ